MADTIEDVGFEVDGGYGEDGRETRGFLTLTGDFVDTFTAYLADEDAGEITLQIPRSVADRLVSVLAPHLFP